MQYSQEHLKTMVYAEFGGQTECIMGNWKIVILRRRKPLETSRGRWAVEWGWGGGDFFLDRHDFFLNSTSVCLQAVSSTTS